MLVSRISPAPRSAASCAHATASRPVGVRPPARYASHPPSGLRLRVDRQHHALRTERARELVDQLGPLERSRVDRGLVGAGVQHGLGVRGRADPATDRERDEDVVGRPPRQLDHRLALVGRRSDIEEHELVGAGAVVSAGQLDRVSGIAQVDEPDALHDPPAIHVQARDDPFVVHQ